MITSQFDFTNCKYILYRVDLGVSDSEKSYAALEIKTQRDWKCGQF